MRKATWSDKDTVIAIIAETFKDNPGVCWMLKKRRDHNKSIRTLAEYAFVKAHLHKGVYISSNEKGVALCYFPNSELFSWSLLYFQFRFLISAVNILRIPKLLWRESYRNKQRPKNKDYLYCWFLGVLKDGAGAAFELRDGIMAEARTRNLPIYLETTLKRNQMAYERSGFETYHHWTDDSEGIEFWFMKLIP